MLRDFLHPAINNQKIFVLWWQISEFSNQQTAYEGILSPEEMRRANRFISPAVKTRFVVARGVLRHILAHYTQQTPQDITFTYGGRGKPLLPDAPFAFNLSHSEDVAILALAQTDQIGVDVEHITPMAEMRRVASDYFSANEQVALFSLPTSDQLSAFYRCWTRKEAYIKARGDGFALPLDKFDVTLTADDTPCLLRTLDDDDPARWQFFHLDPTDGYMGAICVPVGDWTLDIQQITLSP
jgi:4'-phosphopantetheinyl transferase